MQQRTKTVEQLNQYLLEKYKGSVAHKKTVSLLLIQLSAMNEFLTRKKIITSFIYQLETEQDVAKADIYRNYRNALKIILQTREEN